MANGIILLAEKNIEMIILGTKTRKLLVPTTSLKISFQLSGCLFNFLVYQTEP